MISKTPLIFWPKVDLAGEEDGSHERGGRTVVERGVEAQGVVPAAASMKAKPYAPCSPPQGGWTPTTRSLCIWSESRAMRRNALAAQINDDSNIEPLLTSDVPGPDFIGTGRKRRIEQEVG